MRDDHTAALQGLIDRMRQGDEAARRELIARTYERLRHLSAVILRKSFPRMKEAPTLLQTTDIANESAYRLYQALGEIQPRTVNDFFRLAAQRIRWLLLDMAKQTDRKGRRVSVDSTPGGDPEDPGRTDPPAGLVELYQQIELLPENERDVVDLLYFHGLSQTEAAAHLGVTERTVRRYWATARLRMYEALKETLPRAAGMMTIE
jgi:RNA polymerase sigma factor (TIGR02999 family)